MASNQVHRGASVDQVQFGTKATMRNTTPSLMKLDRCINWVGASSDGSFPDNIPHRADSKFVHNRDGQLGSMAAVQYSGPKVPGSQGAESAYILAWIAPSDDQSSPNLVYVDCGTKYRLDQIPWSQVLLNLEQASTKASAYNDYSDHSFGHYRCLGLKCC